MLWIFSLSAKPAYSTTTYTAPTQHRQAAAAKTPSHSTASSYVYPNTTTAAPASTTYATTSTTNYSGKSEVTYGGQYRVHWCIDLLFA